MQVGLPPDKPSYLARLLLLHESHSALGNLLGGATAAPPPPNSPSPKAEAVLLLCQHESQAGASMLQGLPLSRYPPGLYEERTLLRAMETVTNALHKVRQKTRRRSTR